MWVRLQYTAEANGWIEPETPPVFLNWIRLEYPMKIQYNLCDLSQEKRYTMKNVYTPWNMPRQQRVNVEHTIFVWRKHAVKHNEGASLMLIELCNWNETHAVATDFINYQLISNDIDITKKHKANQLHTTMSKNYNFIWLHCIYD